MYCTTCVFSHLAVLIMENMSNCGEYSSSASQCHFSVIGTAFPSILLSFPKTNIQDLHYMPFCWGSRGHKCCGVKYKIFFPFDLFPQIMLNISGLISSVFPWELLCTLAFAWMPSWTKSIFDVIPACFQIFLLLPTDYGILLSKILYWISFKFSAWLTHEPCTAAPSCKSATSSTVIWGCHFSRLLGLLFSYKRKKKDDNISFQSLLFLPLSSCISCS